MHDSFIGSAVGQPGGVAVIVGRQRGTSMTAGTLSTLPSLPPRPGPGLALPTAAAVATHGALSAGSLRTIPLDPDRVFQIEPASQGAGSGAATGAAAYISGLLDRMEYEARGLLNLVCFVSRCVDDARCPQDERLRWREELDRANARIEALHGAGLPRDFLTNLRWREETVLYVPDGDL